MKWNFKIHSRQPKRLKSQDYSEKGIYFVTICTKNKEYFFGNILNAKMILNDSGKIAENFWLKIPEHFKNVELDEFAVMPNHIHGIINLLNSYSCSEKKPQYKQIPVIIGSYKSIVTKHINKMNMELIFQWQKSYYDHIVRDEKSLNNIREYIRNNPLKWELDMENKMNENKNMSTKNYYGKMYM